MNRITFTAVILLLTLFVKTGIGQTIVYNGYSGPITYNAGTTISNLIPAASGATPSINGQTITLAGSGTSAYADGTGVSASFNHPAGIAVDQNGNVYVADGLNERIRKITPLGVVTTFAGSGAVGNSDGTGTAAKFNTPNGLAIDASGNIYVADSQNHLIRKITPAGVVSTLAGSGSPGSANGVGTAASFNTPIGVAVDAVGNVYVGDTNNNLIRKITPSGVVTTVAGSGTAGALNGTTTAASFSAPQGLVLDPSGNIYVADKANDLIRKITPVGVVTTLAGFGSAGFANGTGAGAKFNYPHSLTIDDAGNLYLADQQNNRIRIITPAGVVTTLSGGTSAGFSNGVGSVSTFSNPFSIAIDRSGYLYIADYSNNLVRKVAMGNYGITPSLPKGLNFDVNYGLISGTPSVTSPATAYTIAWFYSSGNSTTSINLAVNPSVIPAPTQSQNYIAVYTPLDSLIVASTDLNTASYDETQMRIAIQYFDGLGRPSQSVQIKGSPTGRDIVQPIAYDQFGRTNLKYLPYTVGTALASDGSYKNTAITDQANFYNPSGSSGTQLSGGVARNTSPYAGSNFENSPDNRVIEQGAPGDPWQLVTSGVPGSGHTTKTQYLNSVANDVVLWSVNTAGSGATGNTFYTAGQLSVTNSSDENQNYSLVYKDKLGRIICKRNQSGSSTYLSTYYVYDDLNNLCYVIPPIPVTTTYPTSFLETDQIFLNFIYGYHYDGRKRLVEKKIPGQGWQYMVYNHIDQLVASQDAIQRGKSTQEWTFTKYDQLGRVVVTGVYQYAGSTPNTSYRVALQGTVNGQTFLWETSVNSGIGYTANAWPSSWTGSTLSINYYDNYAQIPSFPTSFSMPPGASSMTKGLITATLTNVLGTNNMLWLVNYYDDWGRILKSYGQHYLNAAVSLNNYDAISSTYDFTSELKGNLRQHYINGTGNSLVLNVTIGNSYFYDHMGRKTQTWEQINGGTNTLLSQISYNQIGQAYQKSLHSEDNGANFIETKTISYNQRGWVTELNSPHFDEKLYYDTPSGTIAGLQGSFNGNIIEAWYNSTYVSNKGFSYIYDQLNRLTQSQYYQGSTHSGQLDEVTSYDNLGNILSLTRGSFGTQTYIYSGTFGYSYSGNQISSVTNNGNAYKAYTYDFNGNAITQGSLSVDYNILNLPADVKLNGNIFNIYTYASNGKKLRKVSTASGFTSDYIDGIQYKNGAIDFITTEEGRYEYSGSPAYQYDLDDHLGNVRVMIQKNTANSASTVQEQEYFAFGLNANRYDNSTNNKYLYNNKELEDENNLNQYDYGARFYDPVIDRWTGVDLLTEKYEKYSPYAYALNNPIKFLDKDGKEIVIGGPLAQAFVDKLNKESAFQFKLQGGILKPVDPNAQTDAFSSRLVDAINSPKSITFATTPQDQNDYIDQLNTGNVDQDDLNNLSGNAYKAAVLQFTGERMSFSDYGQYLNQFKTDFPTGSYNDSRSKVPLYRNGQKTGLVDKATTAGRNLVSGFLKDVFSGKLTDYLGDSEGTVQTDANGNKTVTYTLKFHDINITYIEGVKKDKNGKDQGNGKVQGGNVQ